MFYFRNVLVKIREMAGILTNCGVRQSVSLVSLLVVGPAELCYKVSEELHKSAAKRKWHVAIHQCEFVTQITRSKLNIGIDFIIFVFDWRVSESFSEVELNISLIDDHYIISGAVCLVNCKAVSKVMRLISHKIIQLQERYNIQFLSANILKPQICVQLGNKILNLVETVLGITSGIPTVGLLV